MKIDLYGVGERGSRFVWSKEPPPLPPPPQESLIEPRCELRLSDEPRPIAACGTYGVVPLCDELILGVRRQPLVAFQPLLPDTEQSCATSSMPQAARTRLA